MWQSLLKNIEAGDVKSLARAITLVENEQPGYEELLQQLPPAKHTAIIGITGPPGAGKSTLVDGLIGEWMNKEKKVAVICVDPSSPFNLGAVLGDRIRMSEWYTHPCVFIRSVATRGAMGGLNPKIIEISDLVKAASFDYLIIETVGVGQSEIEIAGLADVTVVVVVPEAGDEVQTMKAGLMEVADIFIVNKADRPDADSFVKNLKQMLAPAFSQQQQEIPVIKTIASEKKGLNELAVAIEKFLSLQKQNERQLWLMTEKAWQLLAGKKMKSFNRKDLMKMLETEKQKPGFNLYSFIEKL
ncbi:MAG: methylmalonyl Co-A mutase-associated GTPase MeaB [Chitinophagaceae bacterium]